jgi:hypothetical protein
MPQVTGKLKQVKPGVWINPDAVATATCVADGEWAIRAQRSGEINNHERHFMLALTMWDGSAIVVTEMADIVKASSLLKLPHPDTWEAELRPSQA